ncbi:SDR family NAD(P)-dependent oxidoreductase [Psychrobacillus sp. OK032]|uniref:SDR family NAD(P)-dependent oxidoreductase n=1 Tax=Psychrobacillus sp. OK032 TaxID=1884358 RepID=UPI0008AF4EA1|nr:SDR family oxidoreductase [Psychrobacillus sp. OK032]SER59550.1 NAD(P)-dependent dehydrogenase, short-chain alcohol dehydrogenase family [Psychrobacillus sp. OK032]
MELGLKGKVAVITGSSKGIGLYTALQLVKEGASVTICARGKEQLEEAALFIKNETGKEVLTVSADITNEQECIKIIQQTIGHYGRLDILVNNAGSSSANPFESVDTDLWQTDLDLKLFGAIHTSKAAIPYMRKEGGGAIVNVTAVLAKTPPASSLPTTVSRAAGMALTKAMSNDLGKDNIRVNTVCIGLIRSDQIEKRWLKETPELSWEEYSKNIIGPSIPLGRIGETTEAANVITFLVSDAASYVTGTAVNIDGGSGGTL